MNMTYRELLAALNELSDEQLDMTASIFDTESEEIYPLKETTLASELSLMDVDGVVEENQPLMVIKGEI